MRFKIVLQLIAVLVILAQYSSAEAQSSSSKKTGADSPVSSTESVAASDATTTTDKATLLTDVFTRAQRVVDARKGGTKEMNVVLQPAASHLTEISVETRTEGAEWQTVELNKLGTRFDAVRFRSPLEKSANMYWVFLVPPRIEWYVAPVSGEMKGPKTWRRLGKPEFPALDLPEEYSAFFQSVEGGEILPQQDYIIWFSFPDATPVKVHLIVRLVVAESKASPSSIDEIGEAIGLSVPIKSRISQFRVTRLPDAVEPERKP